MQIHRLRLTNFRQHERTELELGAGLTGIVGPNGAGKTTILEAIAWALYGTKAARGGRDTIKRRGAPPRARVEVEMEFTLGRHHYRVVRSLTGAELYQDGEAAAIANSLDSVTERATRLLGMTRDEFFNTYFTGQKELAVMAAMTAPERAQFLSRVLGYEKIRSAQDRLKEQRTAQRARVQALQAGLPDPAELDRQERQACERVETARTARAAAHELREATRLGLAEARPRWEAVQRLREQATALEGELKVQRERLQHGHERLRAREQELAEAREAAGQLEALGARLAPLAALREEQTALDRAAEAAAARQAQATQLEATRQQLAALEQRLATLPTAESLEETRRRLQGLRAEVTAVTLQAGERRAAWVRDAQDARTKRQGLLDQYQELREQLRAIQAAGKDGACPTCARPLGGEYENVLGVLERQLEAVLSNGNFYKQRIEQLREEPADLTELESRQVALAREEADLVAALAREETTAQQRAGALAERERLLARAAELERAVGETVAGYDARRHAEVRRLVRELEPLQLQAERLRARAERAEALAVETERIRTAVVELEARIGEMDARLAALGYREADYRELQAAAQRAEAEERRAELALAQADAELARAQEAAAAVAQRRAEAEERRREAERAAAELLTLQELDRALADLRTDLNQGLRPELSAIASEFVRDLTNGRYTDLELDEDYVPTLLDEGDPKRVISGGEEDVANLALRLAISQMIAERAGQPLSLLVLDEVFGSLDEERRGAVVELLRSLADRFPQVILITHIDTVREGFDRVVRVGLDVSTGVSTVRDEQVEGHDVAA